MTPTVFILTYCEHPALLYGATLVFKTLRVGYPTARVIVVDNGSHNEVRETIRSEAESAGCEFYQTERRPFIDHYNWLIHKQDEFDAIVFVDPDVVFWECVEKWQFTGLMAGRKIPDLLNYGVTSMARLHPSHLWIPSIKALREEIQSRPVNGLNLMSQFAAPITGKLYFWDTLSALYQMLFDKCQIFGENELNAYDHLFYGSHLPVIQPALSDDDLTITAHQMAAMGRINELKGLWRKQDEYFMSVSNADVGASMSSQDAYRKMIVACEALCAAQGIEGEYEDAVNGLLTGIAGQI